jgi:glycosyltransferase involved in cell wall biosynthesis
VHVLYFNPYYPPEGISPEKLIERHHASHDWCAGLRAAGIERVSLLQRFNRSFDILYDSVEYRFVDDGGPGELPLLVTPKRVLQRIAESGPDIVHFNGRPVHIVTFRRALPARTAFVWQHHGGGFPRKLTLPFLRRNFGRFDALFFTSLSQADRWRDAGLIAPRQRVFEIPEGSTRFRPCDPVEARGRLGLEPGPLVLWVGHLNPNKDPITVLNGFAATVSKFPGMRLAMLFGSSPLLADVRNAVSSLNLAAHVNLVGERPHSEMEFWYSAADLFVSGSHSEGSGFALIESMACGCTPVVTDIPPHRTITEGGTVGILWKPGEAAGLSDALQSALRRPRSRAGVREFFEKRLSVDAVGKAASTAYASIRP